MGYQIKSCIDGNNPNPESISFHRSLNEFNIKNSLYNNNKDIQDILINKPQYYGESYKSNNDELYNYSNLINKNKEEVYKNYSNNNNSFKQYDSITNNNNSQNNKVFDISNKENIDYQMNSNNNNLFEQINNNENEKFIANILEENPLLRNKEGKNKILLNNENIFDIHSNKEEQKNSFNIINEEEQKNSKSYSNDENNNIVYEEKETQKEKEKENNNENKIDDVYTKGEKIRNKLTERLKRARAKSSENKKQTDLKSKNILMKAQLLEKVLGNIKKPEDFESNYISNANNNINIQTGVSDKRDDQDQIDNNIPIVNKKKKKKSNLFEE